MAEPREDPREHPADAGDRSESSPNPESAGSQESASDPQTIVEQSIPITAELLSTRPPQREELVRVLSSVCEDPIVVDALVEEIQALSGEPLHVFIKSLENVLAARLEIQGARLDTQHEENRAHGARLEKHSEEIGSLRTEVRVLSAKVDTHGTKIDALGEKIDTHGTILAEMRALNVKLSEQIQSLRDQIQSLRHQYRLLLALFVVLVGLGLLDWLPQSCSRRPESVGGAEASQTDPEPGADALNSPEMPREPSAESLETDATNEADGDRSAPDSDAAR